MDVPEPTTANLGRGEWSGSLLDQYAKDKRGCQVVSRLGWIALGAWDN